jgi:hypothetical protein
VRSPLMLGVRFLLFRGTAMLEIRYSAPHDLDISGTVDELRTVRREILHMIESDTARITFVADSSIEPSPYDSALSMLVVVKGQCPTKISLKNEEEIHIEGSPYCLEAFASFFDFKPDAGKGAHSHYEYYEGNEWIAPDSIPLVIGVK